MKPEIFRSEMNCKPEWWQQWVLVTPCQSPSMQSLPLKSSFSASCCTDCGSAAQQCRTPSSSMGAEVTWTGFWKAHGDLAVVLLRTVIQRPLSCITFYLFEELSADERSGCCWWKGAALHCTPAGCVPVTTPAKPPGSSGHGSEQRCLP